MSISKYRTIHNLITDWLEEKTERILLGKTDFIVLLNEGQKENNKFFLRIGD